MGLQFGVDDIFKPVAFMAHILPGLADRFRQQWFQGIWIDMVAPVRKRGAVEAGPGQQRIKRFDRLKCILVESHPEPAVNQGMAFEIGDQAGEDKYHLIGCQ